VEIVRADRPDYPVVLDGFIWPTMRGISRFTGSARAAVAGDAARRAIQLSRHVRSQAGAAALRTVALRWGALALASAADPRAYPRARKMMGGHS
jgi:hypothetical protein